MNFVLKPRGNRESVRDAILRVWVSTLYGDKALTSTLSRSKAATSVKKK